MGVTPNFLETYDTAMMNWFRGRMAQALGKSVYGLFAPPHQVFSLVRDKIDELQAQQVDESSNANPLPIVSLTRPSQPEHDPTRYTGRHRRLFIKYVDENAKDSIYWTKYPLPYTIDYQFDVWADLIQEHNLVQNQILQDFDPWYRIVVDHGPFWDIKYASLENPNIVDNSDIEPGIERSYRRITYTTKLYGYLWRDEATAGTVLEIKVKWYEATEESDYVDGTGDLLSEQVITP